MLKQSRNVGVGLADVTPDWRSLTALCVGGILAMACSGPAGEDAPNVAETLGSERQAAPPATFFSLPVRWCAVQGSILEANPGAVGEATTDDALWRRHERTSEATYIPQAQITLRSAIIDQIVPDPMLNFPVIADPDTSVGVPGDVQLPVDSAGNPVAAGEAEFSAVLNACQTAWQGILGATTADVGFTAINARMLVDAGGNSAAFGITILDDTGASGFGGRRVFVEDIAFSLPGSTENNATNNPTFPTNDQVDKTLGHEIGHSWPTAATPNGTIGLQHVQACSSTAGPVNIMRSGRQDPDGDGNLNNFQLSNSVQQIVVDPATVQCTTTPCTCETVDQIALLRAAAPAIPGCTDANTGNPCSSLSDVRVDALEDVSAPALDISMVYTQEPDGQDLTRFKHELLGTITNSSFISPNLDYYILADLDDDPATGGAASSLGIPTTFQGAELVTRVRVFENEIIIGDAPPAIVCSPTVWKFDGTAFQVVVDPSIRCDIESQGYLVSGFSDDIEAAPRRKAVSIRMSNTVRGPRAAAFSAQAVTVGGSGANQVVDTLDTSVGMTPPTYPHCTIMPNPAPSESTVTVQVERMRPGVELKAFIGTNYVAHGQADANGNATIPIDLPPGLTDGGHLITIGPPGVPLTADCILDVEVPEECLPEADTTPPTFTSVPPDITVSSCTRPDIGQAQATDECGARVLGNDAPGVFPLGTTVVTWRAADPAGNIATATQRVTVVLGDDASCCPAGTNVILGTSNDDNLTGTNGSDCILGFGAQDTIHGLGGNDFISGGDGNDTIDAGSGNDFVSGGSGQDPIIGGLGDDILNGGDGDDSVQGGFGNDTLSGGQGQDQLLGQDGNDLINGDDGDDNLQGGNGNDNLVGGVNNDVCNGGAGINTFAQCEFGAPNSCADGVQNGTETDLNCGGACPDCPTGDSCGSGSDCQSAVCSAGICQAPSNGGGSLSASLQTSTDWVGGYCTVLNVTNNSSTTATSFTTTLNTNGTTIFTSWNGNFSGTSGVVTVTPCCSWNASLNPGETDTSIGFCANRTVAGALPFIVGTNGTF